MTLKEKVSALPTNPGVYIMKNASGEIIYVGKAKNLKNRVSSYFNNTEKNLKTQTLVGKIVDFDYIIVPSESDALALECNLIKKHQPFYNILLKDGKLFAFIKLDTAKKYPTLEIVRKIKDKKAKYFGPYFNGLSANEIIEIARAAFRLRTCNTKFPTVKKLRPCLNYHIGRCLAPCVAPCEEEYAKEVNQVIQFLNGKTEHVKKLLVEKMQIFSESENFEQALIMRDRVTMVDKMAGRITNILSTLLTADVFAIAENEEFCVATYLTVRDGKVLGINNFNLVKFEPSNFESFVMQMYLSSGLNVKKIIIPPEFKIDAAASIVLFDTYGIKPTFTSPKTSDEKLMYREAKANAEYFLEKNITEMRQKQARTQGAMEALKQIVGLKNLPVRCECYDISNISGTDSVASMTVFVGGEASKADYRKFKIKTVKGISDFDSLKEVLNRRLDEFEKQKDASFSKKPDLIIIDGGKGQLSSCYGVLSSRGYSDKIEMISLAERIEEIFVPGNSQSIILPHTSLALRMVIAIRDEAHRFALSFHQSLRAKRLRESILDDIGGVGIKLKNSLLQRFKTISKIKEAAPEELMKVKGISENLAKKISDKLNEEK